MNSKLVLFTFLILIIQLINADRTEKLNKDKDCRCRLPSTKLIVNGTTVPHVIPWLASVQERGRKSSGHLCGGIVLNKYFVITTADCVYEFSKNSSDFKKLLIRTGINRLDTTSDLRYNHHFVKDIKIDPRYNPEDLSSEGNMALIELNDSIRLTLKTSPACLPFETEKFESYKDSLFQTAGFGSQIKIKEKNGDFTTKILSNDLKNTYFKYDAKKQGDFPQKECNTDDGHLICLHPDKSENGNGICFGDEGGPLMLFSAGRTKVVGFSQFPTSIVESEETKIWCQGPSGFSKITKYITFIKDVLGNDDFCQK